MKIASILLLCFFAPISLKAADLELVLRLQERVSMEKLADDVINPNSPRFNQFYTPEEIRELAGPSDQDLEKTFAVLKQKGFKIINQDKTGLFITVSAPRRIVEKTFSTKIEFTDQANLVHKEIQTPSVPDSLASVVSVIGLNNTRKLKKMSQMIMSPGAIGDPYAGFQPDQIHDIYDFTSIYKSRHTGEGQDIAIATYDNYHPFDVEQYWAFERIKPLPHLDNVYFNGTPYINDDVCAETELDAEFVGMMAPGARIHVFPSKHNDDAGEIQLFTAINDDNRSKVVSYSWGDCEAHASAQHASDFNQVLARAVAQGINIMVASGDAGSFGCYGGAEPKNINADWPAANPYVVAVGGTTLGGPTREEAWDKTGGGVSSIFPQPTWQVGLNLPFSKRAFPDIAFNGDPYTGEPALVHYHNALRWLQFGGTSISAPQWAGFLGLVNAARGSRGPIGYLNPIIYGFSQDVMSQVFFDVTRGSNGAYKAQPGWDATTGLGTPNGSKLFQALTR